MEAVITIDEDSNSVHNTINKGVARLNVIAEDYAVNQVTDQSYATDTHITNFISLLIDVHGLHDTVAFTAPCLIQKLTAENDRINDSNERILKLEQYKQIKIQRFITNLKETTQKLFILICLSKHWTFFYFDKRSATMNYYDPFNGDPEPYIIQIGQQIIFDAFGEIHYELKIIKVPKLLKQIDNFNCGFWILVYIEMLLRNILMAKVVNFDITEMRKNVKIIFEEITKRKKIPYERFEFIKNPETMQNENVVKHNDSDDGDTVMLYKISNLKKRSRSLTPLNVEAGAPIPKKLCPSVSQFVPQSIELTETNTVNVPYSEKLSEIRSEVRKTRDVKRRKSKESAKKRGSASATAKKDKRRFSLNLQLEKKEEPTRITERLNSATQQSSISFQPSGASSLPVSPEKFIKAMEKKEREEKLITELKDAMTEAIKENVEMLKNYQKLNRDNEELNEQLKAEKRKSKDLADKNRNLQKKLERKSNKTPSSRSPYPSLTSRGKAAVVDRIRKLLEEDNPSYTDLDFEEILQRAFPNMFKKFCFNVEETAEFQLQAGLTRRKMEKVRMLFKKKFKRDVFASRKEVALMRKNLKDECALHRFQQGDVMGVVLKDIIKALEIRIRRQKQSGTFTLNLNGKLQLCVLEDKGNDYVSVGVIIGSLLKRNSPDAMLFAGILKGNESRENLEIGFEEYIYQKLNDLKFITVDDERIEIEVFKIADLKMLKIFNGIRQGNAKNSCIVCTLPNDKTFYHFTYMIFEKRNFTIINEDICQDNLTLMSCIDADHIVLPILHIYLGIVVKIIKIMVLELRRIEFDLEKNLEEESDENDEEVLKILESELCEAEETEEQWKEYFEKICMNNDDEMNGDDEESDDDDDEDENEGYCFASNCIVKTTHAFLPERISHTAQPIPSVLKCKNTKQFYHTICVGMKNEEAKVQKKRDFVATEVNLNIIKEVIEQEIKEATVKVNTVREKLKNEYYKDMMPEKESKYAKILENIFKGFGATKQLYYQEYTGNHIRAIVKKSSDICEKLIDPETNRNIANDKIRACCIALEILRNIQDKTEARLLSETEIEEIEKDVDLYRTHMQKHFPNLSICHKNHKLLRHVVQYAKKWKTLGFFSEAPIEHQHKINKERLRLIATTDEFKKCEFLLRCNWEKNYLIDNRRNPS